MEATAYLVQRFRRGRRSLNSRKRRRTNIILAVCDITRDKDVTDSQSQHGCQFERYVLNQPKQKGMAASNKWMIDSNDTVLFLIDDERHG
jgi:hypothetical protein